ncbi:MAG: hypothetical protein U0401_10715 [Anaerolineae bacterium]
MPIPPLAGLCAACRHAKIIHSAKGSLFIMCNLVKTDPRYSKYPVLPVLRCQGFEPRLPTTDSPE